MKSFKSELLGTPDYTQPINQKQKGNRNEVQAAKVLSSWTGARFARTPMSGGLHWDHESVSGDVVCITRGFDFMFSVETKHYASFRVDKVLRSNSRIIRIFDQAINDALEAGKYPLLLLRSNGMPKGDYYVFLNVAKEFIKLLSCPIISEADNLYGVYSTDLFKTVSYKELKNYLYLSHGKH